MWLYCDNKVACDIAHNPVEQKSELDKFFIKEKLDKKILELPEFCQTQVDYLKIYLLNLNLLFFPSIRSICFL